MVETSGVLELDPPKVLLGLHTSSAFIVPLLMASSIWIPTVIRALKFRKYWTNRCLLSCSIAILHWVNWSFETLALHRLMKAEKDSLIRVLLACFEVSTSDIEFGIVLVLLCELDINHWGLNGSLIEPGLILRTSFVSKMVVILVLFFSSLL